MVLAGIAIIAAIVVGVIALIKVIGKATISYDKLSQQMAAANYELNKTINHYKN